MLRKNSATFAKILNIFQEPTLSEAGAGVGKHEESYNILTLFLLTRAGWTETMTKLVKLLAINFDYDVCC